MITSKLHSLLQNAKANNVNTDQEFEAFELIYNLCIEKGYKIEDFLEISDEISICEQQKFIHLVALKDDSILDLVYNFHQTFASSDFCKEDLKNKFELQLLENTFEVSL